MNVADEIAAERKRQTETEGWTSEHDDEHTDGQLAMAAVAYAMPPWMYQWMMANDIDIWPFDGEPNFKDLRRDLVRAGALILAEIERLDRAALDGNP